MKDDKESEPRTKARKTDRGHEDEAFGYRVATEQRDGAWSVLVTQKPMVTNARTTIVEEADGFPHEGQAMDHGMDWAMKNRPYIVEVKPSDGHGFKGMVLNEHGYDEYKTADCGNGDEAQALCDAYVHARRSHDLKVIAERQRFRADARLLEADFHAIEVDAQDTIEEAKERIANVKKGRAQLRKDLAAPQIDFSFVAELERTRVLTMRAREQTDLEAHPAMRAANKGKRETQGTVQA
jgi:hypothetical protein